MHVYKFISGVISLISLLWFSYFFSGSEGEFRLSKLNPIEALEGIAFLFAFGFGVPTWLSYIFSILILFGILVLIYKMVLGLFKRVKL